MLNRMVQRKIPAKMISQNEQKFPKSGKRECSKKLNDL